MTTPNPAFLEVARRKAILHEIVSVLVSDYTSAYNEDPKKKIVSEDVPSRYAGIPPESIEQYINELQLEEESLRLDLLKFEFVRRDDVTSKNSEARGGVRHAQAARQGRGRKR